MPRNMCVTTELSSAEGIPFYATGTVEAELARIDSVLLRKVLGEAVTSLLGRTYARERCGQSDLLTQAVDEVLLECISSKR